MKLTADISLYPVTDNYIAIIKCFIAKMDSYEGLTVVKSKVSTQISGDFDYVMDVLRKEIYDTFEKQRSVFVVKFLLGDKAAE